MYIYARVFVLIYNISLTEFLTMLLHVRSLKATFVGFTVEVKLVTSKHLIQVHLEILCCSVENMA